ncbi:MAG: hypothetical protein AAGA21_02920 [Pseudomonadota bacterium]
MTIDPMAAVTAATDGVGRSAASVDTAASATTSTTGAQDTAQLRVADQGAKVDVFDYSAQHQNKPPAIDTLQPDSKAKYLSNPAALGEKVLERMEGLHQRSLEFRDNMRDGGVGSLSAGAAGSSQSSMAGPASSDVAGTAQPTKTNGLSGLNLMFDYAIETTMISNCSSQFVTSVNTLMRGQ